MSGRRRREAVCSSVDPCVCGSQLTSGFVGKKKADESAVPDFEDEEIEDTQEITETTFTFDSFEQVSCVHLEDAEY